MTVNNNKEIYKATPMNKMDAIAKPVENEIGKAIEKSKSETNVKSNITDEIKGKLSEVGKSIKSIDFAAKAIFPPAIVEAIRTAEGGNKDKQLLSFQSKIDKMSEGELKVMRDHLVKEMANPKNNDDELLGALLNAVNKELDSRSSIRDFDPIPKPLPPFPVDIDIDDIIKGPFPKPIICDPISPNWGKEKLNQKIDF